jgi:hypothetical protein
VGSCAATGTDKEINKATQIPTFLSMTAFSILLQDHFLRFSCRTQRRSFLIGSQASVEMQSSNWLAHARPTEIGGSQLAHTVA